MEEKKKSDMMNKKMDMNCELRSNQLGLTKNLGPTQAYGL